MGKNPGTAEKAKQKIIEAFKENKQEQIGRALERELHYQINELKHKKLRSPDDICKFINDKFSIDNIQKWLSQKEAMFNNAVGNPEEILKIYNNKGLVSDVSKVFGTTQREFMSSVINYLNNNDYQYRPQLIEALQKYIPSIH